VIADTIKQIGYVKVCVDTILGLSVTSYRVTGIRLALVNYRGNVEYRARS